MKYKIDRRYILLQLQKSVGGYVVGVLVVLCLLKLQDPVDFIGTSMVACIFIYFAMFFPRKISLEHNTVVFVLQGRIEKTGVRVCDITRVDYSHRIYNTVTITTNGGEIYKLHPQDAEGFMRAIR